MMTERADNERREAHALCANERSSKNRPKCKAFCVEREALMAAQNVNFVAYGQVGFPHRLLLVANEAVPL